MSRLHPTYLMLIGTIISGPLLAQSEVHRKESLVTNYSIHKINYSNGYAMLHGYFNQIGTFSGSGIVVDNVNATTDQSWPKISGQINVVIPDGSGGWYVGGSIYSVDNEDVGNLFHILPNKTVDKNWLPNPAGRVNALVLSNGILYVGGMFQFISGQLRSFLAAFNTSTGTLTSWNPHASHFVYALAVHGNTIFAGGTFTKMNYGAATRNGIAALNTTDGGVISSWSPSVTGTDAAVRTIAVNGTNVYIGGFFTAVNGEARNSLAAVSTSDGTLNTAWVPNPVHTLTPLITKLILDNNALYVGGTFNGGLGGNNTIKNLGAVSATGTGTAIDAFVPSIGPVTSLALSGSTLYVTGQFGNVNGTFRDQIATLQTSNGALTNWAPTNIDGGINTVALHGNTVFIGGEFTGINWVIRNDFAIIEEATGKLWPFVLNIPTGDISTMVVKGTTLFIGGSFSTVNGEPRKNLAAINLTDGTLLPWNPGATGTTATFDNTNVLTMDIKDDLLYIGGIFTTVGGQIRRGLAAINTSTGIPNGWNPVVGDGKTTEQFVKSLHIVGNTLYIGGDFTLLDGQARTYLGALDATTANVLSWAPQASLPVDKVRAAGNSVYVLGDFSDGIAGALRPQGIAAIDLTSGLATSWNPDFDGTRVMDFAISPTDIYVGGYYERANNMNRPGLASFSLATGELNAWTPDVGAAPESGYDVEALAVSENRLYVGGAFVMVGLEARTGYAEYDMHVCPTGGNLILQGTTLTGPDADSYQWYRNGEPVSGATTRTFEISLLEYGVYAVEATINGCPVRSNDYVYLITEKEDEVLSSIKIYPNPFREVLNIEVPDQSTISLFDAFGKSMMNTSLNFGARSTINTNNLKDGLYILIIDTRSGKFTYRIIKT